MNIPFPRSSPVSSHNNSPSTERRRINDSSKPPYGSFQVSDAFFRSCATEKEQVSPRYDRPPKYNKVKALGDFAEPHDYKQAREMLTTVLKELTARGNKEWQHEDLRAIVGGVIGLFAMHEDEGPAFAFECLLEAIGGLDKTEKKGLQELLFKQFGLFSEFPQIDELTEHLPGKQKDFVNSFMKLIASLGRVANLEAVLESEHLFLEAKEHLYKFREQMDGVSQLRPAETNLNHLRALHKGIKKAIKDFSQRQTFLQEAIGKKPFSEDFIRQRLATIVKIIEKLETFQLPIEYQKLQLQQHTLNAKLWGSLRPQRSDYCDSKFILFASINAGCLVLRFVASAIYIVQTHSNHERYESFKELLDTCLAGASNILERQWCNDWYGKEVNEYFDDRPYSKMNLGFSFLELLFFMVTCLGYFSVKSSLRFCDELGDNRLKRSRVRARLKVIEAMSPSPRFSLIGSRHRFTNHF